MNLSEKKVDGILKALNEKSHLVEWKNPERTEVYALIANEISGKDELRTDGFRLFDLNYLKELSVVYLSGRL